MKKLVYCLCFYFALVVLPGCVEEYTLPEQATNLKLLVVNGSLNVEQGIGLVQLSRTHDLSEADKAPVPETNASVAVEAETLEKFQLRESVPGIYSKSGIALQYGKKFRLRIKTVEGKEYVSDFVATTKTPPISEVAWGVEGDKIQVKVSTQDFTNNTKYYRWEYEETYEYQSLLPSFYKIENNEVVPRAEHEKIQFCWKNQSSTRILVNSTDQLEQSNVNNYILVSQSGGGILFNHRYSILVKQYSISQAEYDYWRMLQKNTEAVGSLFDAQPSYVSGNLTCTTNPEEPVFGYFSVQSISEKRIFISASELRQFNFQKEPLPLCESMRVGKAQLPQYEFSSLIIDVDESGPEPMYIMAKNECIDCRLKGGSTIKPDFW
ncbi:MULTISPECIES: DUF4249 domain-containing protein [Rufibacter]|uniref:DUF4249 domain-containing protein n=1 Tax=Rufibacter quisquiliarum TaxID=1549639 RepID=A0A839GHS6_9BACT|nr:MULTISPECIES: DUF4249 domain-containing protein [Rufibacter]MBA9078160.1 hypothetical protein [Rufibacter quisquiliarum]